MENFMEWLNAEIEDLKKDIPNENHYNSGKYAEAIRIRSKLCASEISEEVSAMENAKKAVIELQEMYEYAWSKSRFDECKALISVFCIINKHIFRQTGWRIKFDGSKEDKLFNVLGDE